MTNSDSASSISIRIADSINQIDAGEWDGLSAGRPFQSHKWYRFGEQVMADCEPIHLLVYQDEKLVGRASLWVIYNEPLPQYAGRWRVILRAVLKKYPLLICRSPLSNLSGIVLSNSTKDRNAVLSTLIGKALEIGAQRKCSVLVLDYLPSGQYFSLPGGFSVMKVSNPGTVMQIRWTNFDEYLAAGNKKDRQHYKRTLREAEKRNIRINRKSRADNVDDAIRLIREVEIRHGAQPNPWMRPMLLNMEMVGGSLLTADIDGRLAGCGLLLEDNNVQMATALGLAPQTPYVYLMLVYEGIRMALERGTASLRWGSGAYELKRQLGFEPEDNGVVAFAPIQPLFRKTLNRFSNS
ncbi:MAG: GNAT family N-acetyltransferase [Anaerolineaceae bacterium]|jgi:predicted N-acyltransferase|nr:MAG: GNAT family N-acetyltransferase [Anaerolineaceae bacterium]